MVWRRMEESGDRLARGELETLGQEVEIRGKEQEDWEYLILCQTTSETTWQSECLTSALKCSLLEKVLFKWDKYATRHSVLRMEPNLISMLAKMLQSSDSFALGATLQTREYCDIVSQFPFLEAVFTNCYQMLPVSQLWVRTSPSIHVCHRYLQLVLLAPLIETQTSLKFLRPSAD